MCFLYKEIFLSVGCPVIVLSPEYMATHIGRAATFKAVVESYFDEALESRWSSLTGIINTNHPKFLGSKNIPFPQLVINNVTFEDDDVYEIQVRIKDGWCIGNTVTLETIGGWYALLMILLLHFIIAFALNAINVIPYTIKIYDFI